MKQVFVLFNKVGLTSNLYEYFVRPMPMYDEYIVKRSMYRKRAAAAVDAEQCML